MQKQHAAYSCGDQRDWIRHQGSDRYAGGTGRCGLAQCDPENGDRRDRYRAYGEAHSWCQPDERRARPDLCVRMAVDDAYGAKEWREGEGLDEVAYRTEKISRRVCRGVSEFAFIQARKMRAKVFGGPKYTVSPVYEGMLKEEMDRAAENSRDVR